MPNVVGKTLAYAKSELHGEGLVVAAVASRPSSTVKAGIVIATSPRPNATVKPGAHVSLVYSRGEVVAVQVPTVVGLGILAAQTELTTHQLAYTDTSVMTWTSPVIPGTVLNQSPLPGATVQSGHVIVLTVLAPGGTYPVPNVTGDSPATAGSTLGQYGLSAGTQSSTCASSVPTGDVVSTSPPNGTLVTQGTAVDLTVSTGQCPVTVPDVVGLDYAQATAQIHNAGLDPSISTSCPSGESPTGYISYQVPTALSSVPPGSLVTAYTGCSTTPTSTTTTTLGADLGAMSRSGTPYAWWRDRSRRR
jgi:beta-lactam-binding protein with PASTA domain